MNIQGQEYIHEEEASRGHRNYALTGVAVGLVAGLLYGIVMQEYHLGEKEKELARARLSACDLLCPRSP